MNWRNELSDLLSQQCSDTEKYKPLISEMECFWNQIRTQYAYSPSDERLIMVESADVRLARVEAKLAAVKTTPSIGICELLEMVERNLRDWISSNQFGYLTNFQISEMGVANVTVSGLLMEHASYGNKTKEEAFTEALTVLAAKGFSVIKDAKMNHYWFHDTETNKQLLEKEFQSFNARITRYLSVNKPNAHRVIREYEFSVNIQDLLNVAVKQESHRDVLNADDFRSLYKDVQEFFEAYSTIQQFPSLTSICLGAMEGIFANLCKMLKVETATMLEYYARFEEERSKNARIREIEAEIAALANFKDFRQIMSDRLSFIEEALEHYNFYKKQFSLDCFGRATLEISPSKLGYEKFRHFETFAAYGRRSELEILDTEDNKSKLETLLTGFEVTDMSIKIVDGHRCIRNVVYFCSRFI